MKSPIDTTTQTFKEIFESIKTNIEDLYYLWSHNAYAFYTETFTASDGQELFVLSKKYSVNQNCISVYKNGIKQFNKSGMYEQETYNNLTLSYYLENHPEIGDPFSDAAEPTTGRYFFTPPCKKGDIITVEYKEVFPMNDLTSVINNAIDEKIKNLSS